MPMDKHRDKLDALSRVSLLADLNEGVLQQIADQCERLTFSPGQVIALEGAPCPSILFLVQGIVQLRQFSREGREHVLAYLREGSCIHLAEALAGGNSLATVEGLTPTVSYAIETGRFLELMARNPSVAMAVSRGLADEVTRLTAMVKDLALHSVRTRLARFLLAHAESTGHEGASPSQQMWTQEAIAARIGTVRDVVGRMLRAFADEGLLRRERGRLVIVDRARLEREAQRSEMD